MSSVPLTQAVTSGDAAAVNAVLANGADVNERTGGGQTPLILATIFGHTHLIPLLLEAGADPHLRDNLGLNAVDWAQRRGATEVIEVLSGTISETSPTIFATPAPKFSARPSSPERSAPPNRQQPNPEKPGSVSEAERSRRWVAGLKQRIAEQAHTEIPDGSNIFRPRLESPTPPAPEIPETPKPQPEIPTQPDPQPEIPSTPPDPQPEMPSPSPEPETPTPPAEPKISSRPVARETSLRPVEREISSRPAERKTTSRPIDREFRISQPEPRSPTPKALPQAEATSPAHSSPPRSTRKRCPQCNAIYNSDLIAYCSYHAVPLVDVDAPVISGPQKSSHAMFWVIIALTLTGSIIVGSLITAYFFNSQPPDTTQQAATPTPAPIAVQKGTPALDRELEGKSVSLPVAECPLNGQEAIPGTVTVRVVIDKTGKVKDAKASGGDWLLRAAASEAAKKSTFSPAMLRGRQTEGTITYTFEP